MFEVVSVWTCDSRVKRDFRNDNIMDSGILYEYFTCNLPLITCGRSKVLTFFLLDNLTTPYYVGLLSALLYIDYLQSAFNLLLKSA